MLDGLIIQSVGGFYYVKTPNGIFETRPRGIFRKNGIKPIVGDRCKITKTGEMLGVIEEILDRRNSFIRPPVANIDQFYFVISSTSPRPNLEVLDRLLAVAEYKEITSYIVFTKLDLENIDEYIEIYESIGYTCFRVDYEDKASVDRIYATMAENISALSGNTGVGKSTLLNAIEPRLAIETGETSQKLGRGKHTTREVTLHELSNGGFVADTPGFSSIDINQLDSIDSYELSHQFIEFREHLGKCKFNNCEHLTEAGCAIKKALGEEKIPKSRYASYTSILEEVKKVNHWEQ